MMTIPAHWSAALVNHLWQSTLFTVAAWLLTLALRRNQARTRYWLWMIASAKFLVPFSLLISMGAYVRSTTAAPISRPAVTAVMEQIAQPFPQAEPETVTAPVSNAVSVAMPRGEMLPLVLTGLWLTGSAILAFLWWRRWRRLDNVVRAATPVAIAIDVPVLSSRTLLEPGVFGIIDPVLLLPEGILERLTGRSSTPSSPTRWLTSDAADPTNWGPPALAFSSGIAGLSDAQSSFNRNRTDALSYSMTWDRNHHTVTLGGDFRRQEFNYLSQQDPRGTFTFTGTATQGTVNGSTLGRRTPLPSIPTFASAMRRPGSCRCRAIFRARWCSRRRISASRGRAVCRSTCRTRIPSAP